MTKNKDTIYIYYDNEYENFSIQLDENERYIKSFKEIKIDLTVVQILPKDKISEVYFLSPDLEYSYKNKLIGKQIYIPQYPSGGKLKNARGIIKSINEDSFTHLASTEYGSSGSPIFLKDSLKIIGIHKKRSIDKEENYGDFISPIFKILKDFIEKKTKNENYENKHVGGSSKVIKRIENEIKFVNENEDNLFKIWVDSDIFDCIASIKGPVDSPYEGGLFKLRVIIPYNYPFKPPDIRFITKIFHPNVNSDGYICSCVLNEYIFNSWSPLTKIISILSFIYRFIKTPLCQTCVQGNKEAISLYFNDKNRFNLVARQWTQSYAHQ